MTEINRRSPVSLVRGPVDPVESAESVDLVDLADLCGSSRHLVLTVCLGIQGRVGLPPCFLSIEYKQVTLYFSFKRSICN